MPSASCAITLPVSRPIMGATVSESSTAEVALVTRGGWPRLCVAGRGVLEPRRRCPAMSRGDRIVVVVTGASAGIGRATVRAFARQGAQIALLARGKDGLEAARREVEAAGGEALAIQTDVAQAGQVEAAAEMIEQRF